MRWHRTGSSGQGSAGSVTPLRTAVENPVQPTPPTQQIQSSYLCPCGCFFQRQEDPSHNTADSVTAHIISATDSPSPILTARVEEHSAGRGTSLDIRAIAAPHDCALGIIQGTLCLRILQSSNDMRLKARAKGVCVGVIAFVRRAPGSLDDGVCSCGVCGWLIMWVGMDLHVCG